MKCTICNKESDKLVDWIPKWFSPYQCTESQLETVTLHVCKSCMADLYLNNIYVQECIVFIHLKYYNVALKQDILHMATKEFINLLQNKFERRKENVHGN